MKKWANEDTQFLKDNYTEKGLQYCIEKLDKTKASILNKTHQLKLKVRYKKCRNDSLIYDKIIDDKITKEISYILGFIWADGYLSNKSYSVNLSINKDDADQIENIILFTDKWNKYKTKARTRNGNICKDVITFSISNRLLYNLLKDLDYDKKSNMSADKILNIIPKELHKYFFIGLSDGDGCFYINKKQYTYQYIVASTYEQDWTYLTRLLDEMNIKYRHDLNITEYSKSSCIRITNKKDIKKFGEYLYKDYDLGLKRKYDKYQDICNFSSDINYIDYPNIDEIVNMSKSGMSIRDIMKKYNIGTSLYYYLDKIEMRYLFESKQSKPLSIEIKNEITQLILNNISNKEILSIYNIKRGVLSNIKKLVLP